MKFKSGIELTRQQIHYIRRKVKWTGFFREHPGLHTALSYLQADHMPGHGRLQARSIQPWCTEAYSAQNPTREASSK
jgi:hypothetical protein